MSKTRYQTEINAFLRACCVIGGFFLVAPNAVMGGQRSDEAKTSVIVELNETDCRLLTRHQPDADVAYQPGVDARGRAVVPADLGSQGVGAQLQTPTKIVIPIEIDLFDRFDVPANPDLYDADAQVGQVVYDDGKVFYNGQRLVDGASDQLVLHCRELLDAEARSPR